jgi:hypothetical protein
MKLQYDTVVCLSSYVADFGARLDSEMITLARDVGNFLKQQQSLVYMAADDPTSRYVGEASRVVVFSPAVHLAEHEQLYRLTNPFSAGVVCTGLPGDGYLRPLVGSGRLVLVLGDYSRVLGEVSGVVPRDACVAVVTQDSHAEVAEALQKTMLGESMRLVVAPTMPLLWKLLANQA